MRRLTVFARNLYTNLQTTLSGSLKHTSWLSGVLTLWAPSAHLACRVSPIETSAVIFCWLRVLCQATILVAQPLVPSPVGTAEATPPPFRPGNPALCGSRPLVTPYYCRLGNLLCFVFVSAYCMFDLSVYYLFFQYFDTVGWVF